MRALIFTGVFILSKNHYSMSDMIQGVLNEFTQEATNTRKMLERVPFEKRDYKPHEKSFPLGRLAAHVAELPAWITMAVKKDGLDFSDGSYQSPKPESNADLLRVFDENVAAAKEALQSTDMEALMKPWTLRRGDHVLFTMPKIAVMRSFALNHLVHHRGQLSVYLRMNDVPLPSIYGPSADEK